MTARTPVNALTLARARHGGPRGWGRRERKGGREREREDLWEGEGGGGGGDGGGGIGGGGKDDDTEARVTDETGAHGTTLELRSRTVRAAHAHAWMRVVKATVPE